MNANGCLDTRRIDYLLNKKLTSECLVTVVGLGSGGAPVVQQLAMCGVRQWHLYDPDVLQPVNLVKHPGLRSQIGEPKVEIMDQWLRDRNPASVISGWNERVQDSRGFRESVSRSDLVICAADDAGTRSFVNEVCVEEATPCATGMVFRTGFGGLIYVFVPGESGCYSCMERYTDNVGGNLDDLVEPTDEEVEHLYGLGDKTFAASGLAIDISLIASLHAQMSLSLLVGRRATGVPPLSFNALTFGIRPQAGAFGSRFESRRLLLRPQEDCHLGCSLLRDPGGLAASGRAGRTTS